MLGGEKTLTISPVKKRGSSSLKPLTSDHENGACCDIILSADQRDARLEKKKKHVEKNLVLSKDGKAG